ncbi:MAG: H-NS histone family protein [Thermomicrobiales bacterium]|nr:H-NS histone family protein [Thermomicrobiales bacterium]
MANIDLDKLDLTELKALRKDVDKTIANYEKRKRQEALAAVEAAAKEKGFSLSELVGNAPKRKGRGPAPAPKYRHPENPDVTWSGLGRRPAWIKDAVASGTPLENFLIER